MYFVYIGQMEATLTELSRETARVIKAVNDGQDVVITEHGKPRFKLQPIKPIDRKAAFKALMDIGPITIRPRK